MKLLIIVLGLFLCVVSASAATIAAPSCNTAAVQTAIAAAVDGDTVTIPAGSCTWTSGLSVNKSITIQGAGVGATGLTNGMAGWSAFFIWTTKATGNTPAGFSRLTGITFDGGTSGGNVAGGYLVVILGNSGNVRIDHNRFIGSRSRGMIVSGYVRGVIDHNTFNVNQFNYFGLVTRHEAWANGNESYCAGFSATPGCGDTSWASPLTPGSREAIYVEDNTFTNGLGMFNWAHDGDYGHRTVFRNNTYNNLAWANHGTETDGRPRSARWSEHYRNNFVANNAAIFNGWPSAIGSRGGSNLVFDNTMTFTNGASINVLFDLATLRAADSSFRSFYVWGRCGVRSVSLTRSGTTVTGTSAWPGVHPSGSTITVSGAGAPFDGTFTATASGGNFVYQTANSGASSASGSLRAVWDGNADAAGYRCLDQAGAGSGALISGGYPSPVTGGHQSLEPVYAWNNLRDADTGAGTNYQLTVTRINGPTNVVVQNRDYYNQVTTFTGAAGIGRGLLSARPVSCTAGVAYWATDQGEWDATRSGADGQLYKCVGPNAWAVHYVPLAYPHPLVSGAVTPLPSGPLPPTDVRIVP